MSMNNLDWLVRGIVAVTFMAGVAAVAREAGYEVGVNTSSDIQIGSTVLDINPIAPEPLALPKSVLLPQETVGGSGTTYKSVPAVVALAPVVKHKRHKKNRVASTTRQRDLSELSEHELDSLKAAYR